MVHVEQKKSECVLVGNILVIKCEHPGADPGFFLRGGALVSSNKPHSFFCRIPVVLENRRQSQGGGGTHPLHPPPRSTPDIITSENRRQGEKFRLS